MALEHIENYFPKLKQDGYSKTSEETEEYNCIAWAGNDATEKWDPDLCTGRYWPEGVPRSLDLSSFVKLYEVEGGYIPCDNASLEKEFEKIAIFMDSNKEVTHAALQKPSGMWTSKLGNLEDIEHITLSSLEGGCYGHVAQILKRPRQPSPP